MTTLQDIPTAARLRELAAHVEKLPRQPLRNGCYKPSHMGTGSLYAPPRGFNMSTYAAAHAAPDGGRCNTAACLAGHACSLWTDLPAHNWDAHHGQIALGLRAAERNCLFIPQIATLHMRPEVNGTLSEIEPATAAEACRRLADIRGAEYVHGERWEHWPQFAGAHDNAVERMLTRRLWGTLESLREDAELYDGILCPTCGEDFTLDLVCPVCDLRRVRGAGG